MKKRLVGGLFVVILFLGLLSGCGNSKTTISTSNDFSSGVQFYDKDGIYFEIPKSWTKSEKGNITYYHPPDGGGTSFLMIQTDSISTSIFNDLYYDSFVEGLKESSDNFSIVTEKTDKNKNDVEWRYLKVLSTIEDVNGEIEFTLFDAPNDTLLEICFLQDTSSDIRFSSDYNRIIDSVEFSNSSKLNDNVYFKDDTLKIIDGIIKITDTQVLPPNDSSKGKNILAFTYEFTDTSDKSLTPEEVWTACFTLSQENENLNYLSSETISANSTRDTATIYYTLNNTSTPVTLTARQGLLGDVLGTKVIDLPSFISSETETTKDSTNAESPKKHSSSGASKEPQESEAPEKSETQTATSGQSNALKSAKNYLNVMAFSYTGLIEQLEYEGYTNAEAVYAVDNCGANWNQQALKSAKNYLNTMAFSYSGLVEQLEYEGFTNAQATYGVNNCGANWNEQAAKSAANYLEMMAFSRDELISQLEYEGFTHEQAVYGAEANGY